MSTDIVRNSRHAITPIGENRYSQTLCYFRYDLNWITLCFPSIFVSSRHHSRCYTVMQTKSPHLTAYSLFRQNILISCILYYVCGLYIFIVAFLINSSSLALLWFWQKELGFKLATDQYYQDTKHCQMCIDHTFWPSFRSDKYLGTNVIDIFNNIETKIHLCLAETNPRNMLKNKGNLRQELDGLNMKYLFVSVIYL